MIITACFYLIVTNVVNVCSSEVSIKYFLYLPASSSKFVDCTFAKHHGSLCTILIQTIVYICRIIYVMNWKMFLWVLNVNFICSIMHCSAWLLFPNRHQITVRWSLALTSVTANKCILANRICSRNTIRACFITAKQKIQCYVFLNNEIWCYFIHFRATPQHYIYST